MKDFRDKMIGNEFLYRKTDPDRVWVISEGERERAAEYGTVSFYGLGIIG